MNSGGERLLRYIKSHSDERVTLWKNGPSGWEMLVQSLPLREVFSQYAFHDGEYAVKLTREPFTRFEFRTDIDDQDIWYVDVSSPTTEHFYNPLALLGADEPRDSGHQLLSPLSRAEVASIEPLLAVLWDGIEHASLSEVHRAQIVAMGELIKAEQLAAVPGETPRWKLVGTVRAALRYLAKDVPKDALAWWKLIELLEQIDWTTIAGELPGL